MAKNVITKAQIQDLAKRHGLQAPTSISLHPITVRVRYEGDYVDDAKMLHAAGVADDLWDNEGFKARVDGADSNVPAFGHLPAVIAEFTTAYWNRRPVRVGK